MCLNFRTISVLLLGSLFILKSCQRKVSDRDLMNFADRYLNYIKNEDYDKAYSLSIEKNKSEDERIKKLSDLEQLSICIKLSGWKYIGISKHMSNLFSSKIEYKIECSEYMDTYLDLYIGQDIIGRNVVVMFDIRYEKSKEGKKKLILKPAMQNP